MKTCPFIIAIDSAENVPWTFQGMRQGGHELFVQTQWVPLGRHPNQVGDYSILGLQEEIAIERKSVQDCHATITGWDGRRERFEQQLSNMSKLQIAAVVVEGNLMDVVSYRPPNSTQAHLAKIVHRSLIGLMTDYRVPWLFCGSRDLAELTAFRIFWRFWKARHEGRRSQGTVSGSLDGNS